MFDSVLSELYQNLKAHHEPELNRIGQKCLVNKGKGKKQRAKTSKRQPNASKSPAETAEMKRLTKQVNDVIRKYKNQRKADFEDQQLEVVEILQDVQDGKSHRADSARRIAKNMCYQFSKEMWDDLVLVMDELHNNEPKCFKENEMHKFELTIPKLPDANLSEAIIKDGAQIAKIYCANRNQMADNLKNQLVPWETKIRNWRGTPSDTLNAIWVTFDKLNRNSKELNKVADCNETAEKIMQNLGKQGGPKGLVLSTANTAVSNTHEVIYQAHQLRDWLVHIRRIQLLV